MPAGQARRHPTKGVPDRCSAAAPQPRRQRFDSRGRRLREASPERTGRAGTGWHHEHSVAVMRRFTALPRFCRRTVASFPLPQSLFPRPPHSPEGPGKRRRCGTLHAHRRPGEKPTDAKNRSFRPRPPLGPPPRLALARMARSRKSATPLGARRRARQSPPRALQPCGRARVVGGTVPGARARARARGQHSAAALAGLGRTSDLCVCRADSGAAPRRPAVVSSPGPHSRFPAGSSSARALDPPAMAHDPVAGHGRRAPRRSRRRSRAHHTRRHGHWRVPALGPWPLLFALDSPACAELDPHQRSDPGGDRAVTRRRSASCTVCPRRAPQHRRSRLHLGPPRRVHQAGLTRLSRAPPRSPTLALVRWRSECDPRGQAANRIRGVVAGFALGGELRGRRARDCCVGPSAAVSSSRSRSTRRARSS
jgi:hypothetical protein